MVLQVNAHGALVHVYGFSRVFDVKLFFVVTGRCELKGVWLWFCRWMLLAKNKLKIKL